MLNKNSTKKNRCVVISQPMYFPWIGMLEQIKLCDAFVYYDDVQFSRGFFNRVQVKTLHGVKWLTVPLSDFHRGQLICDVKIDNSVNWKKNHLDILKSSYLNAPYCNEMLEVIGEVFSNHYEYIADLAIASTEVLLRYYSEISKNVDFYQSSELDVLGKSSQRLIDLSLKLKASHYLTGHGAKKYLDHKSFNASDIDVDYIDYELDIYPQMNGAFTPYVSSLDLIANCGKSGRKHIKGKLVDWNVFLEREYNIEN